MKQKAVIVISFLGLAVAVAAFWTSYEQQTHDRGLEAENRALEFEERRQEILEEYKRLDISLSNLRDRVRTLRSSISNQEADELAQELTELADELIADIRTFRADNQMSAVEIGNFTFQSERDGRIQLERWRSKVSQANAGIDNSSEILDRLIAKVNSN